MLISLVIIKIIVVFIKIYQQSQLQIFMIDWEPRKWFFN